MALRRLSSQIKAMPFFMELTGVGFFTFSPLISMVPPDAVDTFQKFRPSAAAKTEHAGDASGVDCDTGVFYNVVGRGKVGDGECRE